MTESLDTAAQLFGGITTELTTRLRALARPAPPTLVAVAHGSRHPAARRTVSALVERVRALRPGLPVRLGHIELSEPLLADTLAGLSGEVVLVPLLFGLGHHVTYDLPGALADAPHLSGRVAAPLGPHPLLAAALHARLTDAGWRRPHAPRAGVVLAAAGSRSPVSAADTSRTAALLSERLEGVPVLPGYASASAPTVPEAVATLRSRGCERVAVASCFTAPGLFASRTRAQAPWIAAAPLGAHPAVARLVVRRYEEAVGDGVGDGCPVAHGLGGRADRAVQLAPHPA